MKNVYTDHVEVGDKVEASSLLTGTVIKKTRTPTGYSITVQSDSGITTDFFQNLRSQGEQ